MVSYTGVTWKGKYYLKVGSLLLTQTEVRVATNRNKKYLEHLKKKGKTVTGARRRR